MIDLTTNEVIAERIGRGVKVFLKYDGLNPTGSFKDRGMTVAISKAAEAGARAVICASTGNTSASAAAYAAKAGMRAAVLVGGKSTGGIPVTARAHFPFILAMHEAFGVRPVDRILIKRVAEVNDLAPVDALRLRRRSE